MQNLPRNSVDSAGRSIAMRMSRILVVHRLSSSNLALPAAGPSEMDWSFTMSSHELFVDLSFMMSLLILSLFFVVVEELEERRRENVWALDGGYGLSAL